MAVGAGRERGAELCGPSQRAGRAAGRRGAGGHGEVAAGAGLGRTAAGGRRGSVVRQGKRRQRLRVARRAQLSGPRGTAGAGARSHVGGREEELRPSGVRRELLGCAARLRQPCSSLNLGERAGTARFVLRSRRRCRYEVLRVKDVNQRCLQPGAAQQAPAGCRVLSRCALQVLYEDCRMVAVNAPYVAGFLAFREVPFMVEAVQRLQQEQPELRPQVRHVPLPPVGSESC